MFENRLVNGDHPIPDIKRPSDIRISKKVNIANNKRNMFSGCVFLSRYIRVIVNPYSVFPGCKGTTCSKQVQYPEFKWLQQDLKPKQLSSLVNTQNKTQKSEV